VAGRYLRVDRTAAVPNSKGFSITRSKITGTSTNNVDSMAN